MEEEANSLFQNGWGDGSLLPERTTTVKRQFDVIGLMIWSLSAWAPSLMHGTLLDVSCFLRGSSRVSLGSLGDDCFFFKFLGRRRILRHESGSFGARGCVAAMLDLEERKAHPSSGQRLVNRGFPSGRCG